MKRLFTVILLVLLMPLAAAAQGKDPFGYEFDDYLCHDIPQADWVKPHYRLEMSDQFGETASEALRAVFICNPVKKRVIVDGDVVNEDSINNEELHFTCYEFDPGRTNAEDKEFKVQNEFEENAYRSRGPRMICVPTVKSH